MIKKKLATVPRIGRLVSYDERMSSDWIRCCNCRRSSSKCHSNFCFNFNFSYVNHGFFFLPSSDDTGKLWIRERKNGVSFQPKIKKCIMMARFCVSWVGPRSAFRREDNVVWCFLFCIGGSVLCCKEYKYFISVIMVAVSMDGSARMPSRWGNGKKYENGEH